MLPQPPGACTDQKLCERRKKTVYRMDHQFVTVISSAHEFKLQITTARLLNTLFKWRCPKYWPFRTTPVPGNDIKTIKLKIYLAPTQPGAIAYLVHCRLTGCYHHLSAKHERRPRIEGFGPPDATTVVKVINKTSNPPTHPSSCLQSQIGNSRFMRTVVISFRVVGGFMGGSGARPDYKLLGCVGGCPVNQPDGHWTTTLAIDDGHNDH